MELGLVLGPQGLHAQHVVAGDGPPVLERHPVIGGLLAVPTEADAEDHPATAQMVERGQLLGQDDGVVLGDQHHPGAEEDPPGGRRRRGQGHDGVEAAAVVVGVHPLDQGRRLVGPHREVGVLG